MTRVHNRAWRFGLPSTDPTEAADGLTITTAGKISMVDGLASIRQSILLLLATRPGERLMLPRYGCHIHRLLFSPNDETTAGLAIHYVRQAIQRWEPRVRIVRLDALPSRSGPISSLLEIRLEYTVPSMARRDALAFQFNLNADHV